MAHIRQEIRFQTGSFKSRFFAHLESGSLIFQMLPVSNVECDTGNSDYIFIIIESRCKRDVVPTLSDLRLDFKRFSREGTIHCFKYVREVFVDLVNRFTNHSFRRETYCSHSNALSKNEAAISIQRPKSEGYVS